MLTIAETKHYAHKAEKLLSADERQGVIDKLAMHPLAGEIMVGTGGVRKLRFGKADRGKSGGVRVIYYFYSESAPLFLLELFGKNEKDNLTKAERNALAEFTHHMKKRIKEKYHGKENV